MNKNNDVIQKRSKEVIIDSIEKLTQRTGFIYALALLLYNDFFFDPDEAAEINWYEKLSFQEASFLVGLMIKHPINLALPADETELGLQIDLVYKLFSELHQAHADPLYSKLFRNNKELPSQEELEKTYSEVFGTGEHMTEPIFYSGSGAYDFQYLELAEKKYTKDDGWMLENMQIDIATIIRIATNLKHIVTQKLDTITKPVDFVGLCQYVLELFCVRIEDIRCCDIERRDAFLSAFSLVPGTVNAELNMPGAYNRAESHPIIQLKEDCYFLPVFFNLTRSIYESPYYWMSSDKSYQNSASTNRGESTEYIAYEMMVSVFGKNNVYKGVKVFKNKKECITDIDVLAIKGNKAVIIQAKSKKLTELSRRGDSEKLRSDFSEAIQDAYEQGLASRTSIIDKKNTLIKSDGEELLLNEYIDDAYIICITSDHYPAVTHQVDVYLKKKSSDPYPLAMSVFDLDVLVFYLSDPFEFLYYLRQRINLSDYYKADSEMTLLAFHLNQKLYPDKKSDRIMLGNMFAQLIDANFPAMKGYQEITNAVEKLHHKWTNQEFQKLVDRIKETGIPGFTDAIFYLYDLSGKGADELINNIKRVKEKTLLDGLQHDATLIYENGRSGITLLSINDSPTKLKNRLLSLATARKYKTKADQWLALGSVANSSKIVDAVAFNKEPWKEDVEMDEIVKVALKPGIPLKNNGIKIGRNDPCYCGSGIKYKKCCGR